jgi:hypothetical protein
MMTTCIGTITASARRRRNQLRPAGLPARRSPPARGGQSAQFRSEVANEKYSATGGHRRSREG